MPDDLIRRLAEEAGFRVMDGGRITVWPERGEMPEIEPMVEKYVLGATNKRPR